MSEFTFDLKCFATVKVEAANETEARNLLHGWGVDTEIYDFPAEGQSIVCTQISADDGYPELVDDLDDES